MKSYKYIAFSLFTAAFTLSSCSDFLDTEPDQRVDIDNEEKVVKLLVSAYPDANYALLTEFSSDNIIDNNSPHKKANSEKGEEDKEFYYNRPSYSRLDDEIFAFEPGKSGNQQDSPSYVWGSFYQSIATVNLTLQAIDELVKNNGGVMSEKLKAARGEALLIRAYSHFILVNIFSQAYKDAEASKNDIGIPYVTKPEDKVHVSYDRGNVADVYEKIEDDLEEGLKYINDNNYEMPKYHFNVNAAHAFAARFYLYKRDYDKVIEHADAVLGKEVSALPDKLIKLSEFASCVNYTDYVNKWIDPEANNNLMLITTMSSYSRHLYGYRYAWNSNALSETVYHAMWKNGKCEWNGWTVIPYYYVCGGLFYSGNSDYGYFPTKVGESFEYTDKVAGIGYAHIVRREFTASSLLLDRAEAKLLSTNHRDVNGAIEDILAYEDSRQSMAEADKATFSEHLNPLTKEMLEYWYSNPSNPNCFADWDFTQRMSSSFVVPREVVVYMNAVNDMRRFETVLEGTRFFDLKRYGMEYSHFIGPDKKEYKLTWNDVRRALEIPQEALQAGLESSHPEMVKPDNSEKTMYSGREISTNK